MRKRKSPVELAPEEEHGIQSVLRDMIERDESLAAQMELVFQSLVSLGAGFMQDGKFVPISKVKV